MRNNQTFNKIDLYITETFDKYGLILLRYSIGIVFIWFGALKLVGRSPAEQLVKDTIVFIPPDIFLPILAIWEMTIGVTLMIQKLNRVAIFLLFLQMPGTMLPLILLPEVCFQTFPLILTLEGQYIIKNLIIISGGIVVGSKVRTEESEQQNSKLI
ncbi:MAG: hypothetical protein IH840_13785 [Candidatus Heimdallarchaeota archaeon]|nr:hypothetical protein [Candidatus Heimdallarchaeota archaeon]